MPAVRSLTLARRGLTAVAILALLATACSSPERRSAGRDASKIDAPSAGDVLAADAPADAGPDDVTQATGTAQSGRASASTTRKSGTAQGPTQGAPGVAEHPVVGTPTGVSDDAVHVVYYWKGDRTRTSPFLRGTTVESNVDEAEAFRVWVDYINANPRGELMGLPYDLHGRKLVGSVVESGNSPEEHAAAAERIAGELRPFAALAAHGSISAYTCPVLAAAGVFNLATYDLDFGLYGRTKGWCTPSAASFDDQVRVMERYVPKRVATTKYNGSTTRNFGFLYAEYPGLVDSAPKVVDRLTKAGVPIGATASLSASLTEAQQQSSNVVAKFVSAGVNTVIIPDAGAPLSFTHAAEAMGYRPDYVIWPCSGQDSPAMVRLANASQWERASGLTCYDPDFMIDLAHSGPSQRTEWYAKYMSMKRGEPPAQAPYLYASFVPLLAGLTGAGRDLTADRFRTALGAAGTYRYSAEEGRTSAADHMLVALERAGRPLLGDFTVLKWSNAARREGSTLQGDYVFPEKGRRYAPDASF